MKIKRELLIEIISDKQKVKDFIEKGYNIKKHSYIVTKKLTDLIIKNPKQINENNLEVINKIDLIMGTRYYLIDIVENENL